MKMSEDKQYHEQSRIEEMVGGQLDPEDNFRRLTLEGKWEEVFNKCQKEIMSCTIKINEKRDTALHVAVNEVNEYAVTKLVTMMIKDKSGEKALELKNERGDTPLHLAASRGLKSICECIIGKNEERKHLIQIPNKEGEIPLFQAALSPEKQTFMYLISLMPDQSPDQSPGNLIRKNRDSILHCAIRGENFDYALIIMEKYPNLGDICNEEGFSPLKVLATRPLAFKSGSNLNWFNTILYHCVHAETLDVKKEEESYKKKDEQLREYEKKDKKFPEIYNTCYQFLFVRLRVYFNVILGPLASGKRLEEKDPEKMPEDSSASGNRMEEKDPEKMPEVSSASGQRMAEKHPEKMPEDSSIKVPANYATCHQFMKLAYIYILGLSGAGVEKITKMKQKHKWSGQLLSKFMEKPYESYIGSGGPPQFYESGKKDFISAYDKGKFDSGETTILVAARNGIVEMVNEIISKIPSAIHETNFKKKNVLHVAVENTQPSVVKALKNWSEQEEKNKLVFENLTLGVDEQECTLLHLAATENDEGWVIPGTALRMMWRINWFQYVKGLLPEHFRVRSNKAEKLAEEIFRNTHEKLVNEASEWLKDTSESCSVVAALLAGISFAASTTVPGGFNSDTGIPALQGKPAFDSFAMCSLIGLCFSVTALVMFLSILTSRKEVRDFRTNLPIKLLLGLSSLFISIVTLFATFCSAHFFVIDDNFKQVLILIYTVTCLPVTFYAVTQFPLYIDLVSVIATKVPRMIGKGDYL